MRWAGGRAMDCDLLITNATVATLRGPGGPRTAEAADEAGVEPGWAVAVAGDRIAWVGPAPEWDGRAARTIDAGGNLVTPGYVDPHNHLVYAGDRAFELGMKLAGKSYLEILAAGGGIAHTSGLTRAATVDELVAETRPRLDRMMAGGITTVEAKSGYALDLDGELRMLEAGARLGKEAGATVVNTFLGAHAVPDEYKGRTDAYVDLVIDEMIPRVAQQGIARYCDVFVEEGVFTYDHGAAIFDAARQHGMGLRLHADEIVNTRGAQLAAEAGCISADHLLRVSQEGIEAMADAGTVATLLPTVPLTLFKPEWPSGKAFLDAGVPVALATDHNPNNPVTNTTLVAQLGCFLLGLTPAQAMTAVTWNAACTLGVEGEVGSIEVGKRADLLVHDVSGLDYWVYEPGRQTVRDVVVGGRIVK